MVRQQTRQRGDAAPLAIGAMLRSTPNLRSDESDLISLAVLGRILRDVAVAQNTSMLLSQQTAVAHCKEALNTILNVDAELCWLFSSTDTLQVCLDAAVNSMNVILQDIKDSSSLLDHGKLLDVVCSLCCTIAVYWQRAASLESQGRLEGAQEKIRLQITAAGLPAALSRFTAATWQAVQQLSSRTRDYHQQQQQHPGRNPDQNIPQQHQEGLVRQGGSAIDLIEDVLMLWQFMLLCPDDYSTVHLACEDTLPALVGLTTAAAPLANLLKRIVPSSSSIWLDNRTDFIAHIGLGLAGYLVSSLLGDQGEEQREQQQWQKMRRQLQQGQHHIYLTEKVPELLLQLLAYQVGQLHAASGGVSQALQGRHATDATAGTNQQQEQQQQFPAGCVVQSSHLVLLQSVGLGHDGIIAGAAKDVNVPRYIGFTLKMLSSVLRARYWRASFIRYSSSNSRSSETQQEAGQQAPPPPQPPQEQQETGGDSLSVLASHLLVPAIKVLIEAVLLLLPDKTVWLHAYSLKLVLLLLHIAVPAEAALEHEQGQVVSPLCPWPALPAAVAAGLLRSVVAQLSQAVMYCLLQTDHQQQQDGTMARDRRELLHHYGNILITVCQSVESKHIAAVFRSQSAPDLLITLAAVEAVIRAQACHLEPENGEQQQQQQQQWQQLWPECPAGVSSIAELGAIPSIAQHPLDRAPLLLFHFVSDVVGALHSLVCVMNNQYVLIPLLAADPVRWKLSARVHTLLTTALKIIELDNLAFVQDVKAAPEAAAAAAAKYCNQWHVQAILHSFKILCVACCWFFAGQRTAVIGNNSSRASAWPVAAWPCVLFFKAMRALSCGLSGLTASDPIPASMTESPSAPLLGAAAGLSVGLQDLGADKTSSSVGSMLTALADAYGFAKQVLDDLAAFPKGHAPPAAAADHFASHHKQRKDSCLEQLPSLLQQAMQVGALIRSTMQLAIIESGTSIPASSLASMSHTDLCDTIRKHADSVRPSVGLMANLKNSSTLLCDLADAAVSCIPLQVCCNSPLCTNLGKLSEWQLVSEKACVCAGCGLARYCSKDCQKQHWKLHKSVCRRP